jgi:hypothetical protein
MGEASTERRPGRHASEAMEPRETIRGPTRSNTWKAPGGNRDGRRLPETPAGSKRTARTETEASRNLGDLPSSWPEGRMAEDADGKDQP